jgi:PAS domain S-box-containing protein
MDGAAVEKGGREVPERLPTSALTGLPLALVLTNPAFEDNPIVYVNAAFTRLTGYAVEAAVGRNCRFLQGPETEPDRVAQIREAVASGEDIAIELTNHRADGSAFLNRLTITPIVDREGIAWFLGTLSVADVSLTETRLAAVELKLAEVQHRVKNHLAMIVSMIRLQARSGPAAADDFAVIARRVEALQLLYEELSEGGVGSTFRDEVPLGAYISRIAAAVGHLDGGQGIRVNVMADEVMVDASTAGRVGLLVSEVLTNAFRHAFTGRDTGLVETRVQRLSGVIRIQVSDDGVGLPEGTAWPTRGNLGARIVTALLDGLGARHAVTTSAAGTTVTIDLPGPEEPACA